MKRTGHRRSRYGRSVITAAAVAFTLSACISPIDHGVSVTNASRQALRITGSCSQNDATFVKPGETITDQFSLGAQCRIDNGDGLDGMLACVTLKAVHTVITTTDLRDPPGPNECWGQGK